jgi:hypothetical protein
MAWQHPPPANTCIVEQQVTGAVRLKDRLGTVRNRLRARHIGQDSRNVALGAKALYGVVEDRLFNVGNDDCSLHLEEGLYQPLPDAACPPGNDGDFSTEIVHVSP